MKRTRNGIVYLLLALLPCVIGAAERVDPTRPPDQVLTPANTEVLKVTAIFIYPNKKMAIINGQSLTIGDRVGEFIITAINPYSVELMGSQNNRETLSLTPAVKQRTGIDFNRD